MGTRQDYARQARRVRQGRYMRHTGQRPPVAAAVAAGMGLLLAAVGAGALAIVAAIAAAVMVRQ